MPALGPCEDSITGLVTQLCDKHVGEHFRAFLIQPYFNKKQLQKKAKKKAYDTLFGFLIGPLRWQSPLLDPTLSQEPDERIQILSYALDLRRQRRFDDANNLEMLLQSIVPLQPDKTSGTDFSEIRAVLKLLVLLADTSHTSDCVIGYEKRSLPLKGDEDSALVLPAGPMVYGDSRFHRPSDPFYMHFPSELFKGTPVSLSSPSQQVFHMLPGENLSGRGLFNCMGYMNDIHEKYTVHTLFGGLVQPKVISLDDKLQLPNIHDDEDEDSGLFDVSVPRFQPKFSNQVLPRAEEVPEMQTSSVSKNLSYISDTDSGIGESIWEEALDFVPSRHYTWEIRGSYPRPTDKPYLTEAGDRGVDEWYNMKLKELKMICPSMTLPTRVRISQSDLVKDIISLLIGIPSTTYGIIKETMSFEMTEGVYMSGLTPESLKQMSYEFIECGTYYNRLTQFSLPPLVDSFYTKGLVLQAFLGAVRRILQHYRAVILSIPQDITLLRLKLALRKTIVQLRYLAMLCKCKTEAEFQDENNIPTGVNLLSYIYKECLECSNTDNYPMLLSILQTSCAPYTIFVHDWVFHGICRDKYGEFLIEIHEDYLQFRDKNYWTKGYTLTTNDVTRSVPLFLSDLANDIFICGKSINLLKACHSQHFLCNLVDHDIPQLSITFSQEDLRGLTSQCEFYVNKMQQIARQLTISRQEKEEREEKAKMDLLQKAKQVAAQELQRLQDKIKDIRKLQDAKKRKQFDFLKEQMETDQQRRASVKEAALKEDKEYIARVTRQEEAMDAEEKDLEKRAREEIVEYYEKLTEEAAHREQKALWHVRRGRLQESRERFLQQDRQYWEAAMTSSLQGEVVQSDITPEESRSAFSPVKPTSAERYDETHATNEPKQTDDVKRCAHFVNMLLRKTESSHSSEKVESVRTLVQNVIDDKIMVNEFAEQLQKELNLASPPSMMPLLKDTLPSLRRSLFSDKVHIGSINAPPIEVLKEPSKDDQDDTSLPSWVNRSGGDNPVIVSGKDTTDHLPLWAEKGLKSGQTLNVFSDHDLPKWAERSQVETTGDSHETPENDAGKDGQTSAAAGCPSSRTLVQRPPTPTLKTGLKLSDIHYATAETQESPTKSSVHVRADMHATTETSQSENPRSQIRVMKDMSATKETESDEPMSRPNIKIIENMSASKETESQENNKPHLKRNNDMFANQQSSEEMEAFPKLKRNKDMDSSKETESKEWVIKKASTYGHVSERSTAEVQIPRLKPRPEQPKPVSDIDFKDFRIKPRIRISKTMSATKESEVKEEGSWSGIRIGKVTANVESEAVNMEEVLRQKFKTRNVYGHSSDSTVQQLLYGSHKEQEETQPEESEPEKEDPGVMEAVWLDTPTTYRYQDKFDFLFDTPVVDLLSSSGFTAYGGLGDYGISSSSDVGMYHYMPLPELLRRSVTAPLLAQISLVNDSIINYFTVDLKIKDHFKALRKYLFMGDGDFAQILSDILLEKLASCPKPHEMLNPIFLNGALNKALKSSIHVDDPFADHLSFVLKYVPKVLSQNAHDTLDCLELRYTVKWPLNIVITDALINKYSKVFSFMLQLKRSVWVLKDVWHHLKRDALVHKVGGSCQFRQLQLHRQEMQHFVKVMQGYIANQVIHVTWNEFSQALKSDVHNLDDLHKVHSIFLEKAIFRCLLNKKAGPLMKIIQDIFCLIMKFRLQLVNGSWNLDKQGEATHSNFNSLATSYKVFREYSVFLFKVVNKLSIRGYQPHLQELLLRLNFNDYYKP